ncbi:hypothetical protein EV11_1177 [Prochlorococcus sp. SS52]|nr:hypothetical protein EV10_1618 [Prochlorococcus marinus str. SS51]KGG35613.1 hypothetical protein EV11_1177 [Prochlorococcus sp. SS52]
MLFYKKDIFERWSYRRTFEYIYSLPLLALNWIKIFSL